MDIEVIFVQIIAAILTFLVVNFLGLKSLSYGYQEMTLIMKADEPPAFNYLFRVLTPPIVIIFLSTFLYYMNLDKFVFKIYYVSIYYVLIRILFNVLGGRIYLVNWPKQFLHYFSVILVSYFLYEKILKEKKNIFPDFETIANELWIIIAVFLYQLINKAEFDTTKSDERKYRYIHKRFTKFQKKYGEIIQSTLIHKELIPLVYAIMIHEDLNRSVIIRTIEYISFYFSKKPHTLGVMQVYTDKMIDNSESVNIACMKINSDAEEIIKEYNSDVLEFHHIQEIISRYNIGSRYNAAVHTIYKILLKEYFPKDKFYDIYFETSDYNSFDDDLSNQDIKKDEKVDIKKD